MQAHLSTLTFDPDGVASIDLLPSADLGESRRRMNRIATLDGGSVVNDFGHSDSDRTITLRWRQVSAAYEAGIERLVQDYSRLHVSTSAGFFLVAPESYRKNGNESTLVLLALQKLN